LQVTEEKVLLIISAEFATDILPFIDKIRQVDTIFIFGSNTPINVKDPNIVGIWTNEDELVASLHDHIDIVNQQ
jgi:hypothetical protein